MTVFTNGCFIAGTCSWCTGHIPRDIIWSSRIGMIITYYYLPIITRRGLQTFFTKRIACGDAYQTLPDFLPGQQDPLVVLVWSGGGLPFLTILSIWVGAGRQRPLPATTSGANSITHSGRDRVLCGTIMIVRMWRWQALVWCRRLVCMAWHNHQWMLGHQRWYGSG